MIIYSNEWQDMSVSAIGLKTTRSLSTGRTYEGVNLFFILRSDLHQQNPIQTGNPDPIILI
jgi:hypothetical protein